MILLRKKLLSFFSKINGIINPLIIKKISTPIDDPLKIGIWKKTTDRAAKNLSNCKEKIISMEIFTIIYFDSINIWNLKHNKRLILTLKI